MPLLATRPDKRQISTFSSIFVLAVLFVLNAVGLISLRITLLVYTGASVFYAFAMIGMGILSPNSSAGSPWIPVSASLFAGSLLNSYVLLSNIGTVDNNLLSVSAIENATLIATLLACMGFLAAKILPRSWNRWLISLPLFSLAIILLLLLDFANFDPVLSYPIRGLAVLSIIMSSLHWGRWHPPLSVAICFTVSLIAPRGLELPIQGLFQACGMLLLFNTVIVEDLIRPAQRFTAQKHNQLRQLIERVGLVQFVTEKLIATSVTDEDYIRNHLEALRQKLNCRGIVFLRLGAAAPASGNFAVTALAVLDRQTPAFPDTIHAVVTESRLDLYNDMQGEPLQTWGQVHLALLPNLGMAGDGAAAAEALIALLGVEQAGDGVDDKEQTRYYLQILAPLLTSFWNNQEQLLALRAETLRRDLLYKANPLAVFLTDAEGIIIHANPQAQYLISRLGNNMRSAEWSPCLSNGQVDPQREKFFDYALEVGDAIHDYRQFLTMPDTGLRTVSINSAPVLDDKKGFSGLVVVISDTTEYHRAVEDLNRAFTFRTEFLANISHELRTPIHGIMGMASLLRDELSDPDQLEFVDLINLSVQNLSGIVEDLIDFTRLGRGGVRIELRQFSLSQLVDGTCKQVEARARQKGLYLRWQTKADPDKLVFDPVRLSQIISNLLNNAIKFTEKGGIEVQVNYQAGQSAELEIVVSDTGIGIPADKLNAIFEPFTQLEHTYTKAHSGIGLGLNVVLQLCAILSGKVDVESTPEKGSQFTVTLPIPDEKRSDGLLLKNEKESLEGIPVGSRLAAVAAPSDGALPQQRRILLVEDEEINQLYIQRLVEKEGFAIDICSSAYEALALLGVDGGASTPRASKQQLAAGSQYALMLVDIGLPGMDGMELVRRVRGYGFGFPIIAVTAHVGNEDRDLMLRLGANDFLSKPVKQNDTLLAIARQLQKKHPSPGSP